MATDHIIGKGKKSVGRERSKAIDSKNKIHEAKTAWHGTKKEIVSLENALEGMR